MKVLLVTPKYDGREHAGHALSIRRAIDAGRALGWDIDAIDACGCPILPRARNQLVAEALYRGADEIVFVDSDIAFEPEALIQVVERDCDIVGAAPQARPVRWGEGAKLCWRPKAGVYSPDDNGLMEADGLATGCMKVRRRVFEAMFEQGLVRRYILKGQNPATWPYLRTYFWYDLEPADLANDPELAAVAAAHNVPADALYFDEGEDFYFCRKAREAGFRVFVDCELEVRHHEGRQVLDFSLKRAAQLQRLRFEAEEAAQQAAEQGEQT